MKRIILSIVFLLSMIGCMKWYPQKDTPACWAETMYSWPVPSDWFERKLTPEKADAMIEAEVHSLPSEWLAFKAQMKKGDQLWFYSKPVEYWVARTGQNGFVILRDCKVVGWYPFLQN